jgi:hypothetical protein
MQNETDPLRRLTVTNSWGERNLMKVLREWSEHADANGFHRLVELCDYLQADELTHVRLATHWIRQMTDHRPEYRDALVAWSRAAVDRLREFYNQVNSPPDHSEPRFSFLRGSPAEEEEFAGARRAAGGA